MPPSTPPQKVKKYNLPQYNFKKLQLYFKTLFVFFTKGIQLLNYYSKMDKINSMSDRFPAACKGIYTWTSSPRTVYNPRKYLRNYQK